MSLKHMLIRQSILLGFARVTALTMKIAQETLNATCAFRVRELPVALIPMKEIKMGYSVQVICIFATTPFKYAR